MYTSKCIFLSAGLLWIVRNKVIESKKVIIKTEQWGAAFYKVLKGKKKLFDTTEFLELYLYISYKMKDVNKKPIFKETVAWDGFWSFKPM
jgi:hypothetical protein